MLELIIESFGYLLFIFFITINGYYFSSTFLAYKFYKRYEAENGVAHVTGFIAAPSESEILPRMNDREDVAESSSGSYVITEIYNSANVENQIII